MRPPTLLLLLLLLVLTAAVAVLEVRLVAISPAPHVVLPLTSPERVPHTEQVGPEKPPPRIVLRVCPPSTELAAIEIDEWQW